MNRLISLLFDLIKSEVFQKPSEENLCDSLASLTKEEWGQLYGLSKAHDLCHVVGAFLEKNGGIADEAVRAKFQKQFYMAVFRYERLNADLLSIEKALETADIPYVTLKGSVIRSLYAEPWMRTSCDIDVLVDEGVLERANESLVSLGYTLDEAAHYHDVSLHSPGGVHLELHFNIQENLESMDRLLSRVWEYTEPCEPFRAKRQLTNDFFVFYHIAHMANHFVRGGCGIKPFIDLHLLRRKWPHDEETVRAYCRECALEHFYSAVIALTDVWFCGQAHTDLTECMQEYVLRGGVYGTAINRIAVGQAKRGGKLRYALSHIFLPYGVLKTVYPSLEKHKWLYPVFQVRRWGRLLFCGGLGRSARELSANRNMDKDTADGTQLLLRELGL